MKESNISKLIELEAGRRGYLTLRLNSGKAIGFSGNVIKLCPAGTSDLLLIAPNGKTIFVETKTLTGTQRQSQKNFQQAVESLGHTYILARKIEDIFN